MKFEKPFLLTMYLCIGWMPWEANSETKISMQDVYLVFLGSTLLNGEKEAETGRCSVVKSS